MEEKATLNLPSLCHVCYKAEEEKPDQCGDMNLNEQEALKIIQQKGYFSNPGLLFKTNDNNGVASISFAGKMEESLIKALAGNSKFIFPMIDGCFFLSDNKDYYLDKFFVRPTARLLQRKILL